MLNLNGWLILPAVCCLDGYLILHFDITLANPGISSIIYLDHSTKNKFSAWISTPLFVFLARFHVWEHPEAHHPARDPAGPAGRSAQGVLG